MACKDCVSGTLHEGTPAGREETVHGRPTYITEPPNGAAAKGIVVIVPDAFGWKLVNTRILADNYAERCQVTVYVPDFMDGMCMFEIRFLEVLLMQAYQDMSLMLASWTRLTQLLMPKHPFITRCMPLLSSYRTPHLHTPWLILPTS